MSVLLRRNFSGAFLAKERGGGAWQLSRRAPHEIEVFVQDAEHGAARAFGAAPMVDLGIEWRAEDVLLTFMSGERALGVSAASAIVHEPLERLYESLPLVSIDADARRFWRRVFRLVRIPGGRWLLKVLTRRRR
ncbi:MAG TPA: hypothetical protein VHS76_16770 [Steroidobacteraceae bacterium]|jgi:hypothetical protein|nr:hypothetical protein [Steroidobacteraceae bacterium]